MQRDAARCCEICEMLRGALLGDPRMVHKEVNASHVLQILRDIWAREHPQREFPEMCLHTVRRLLTRWGWSWRRAHKRRRPAVDPDAAVQFVWSIIELMAGGVDPGYIADADETAFLLHPRDSTPGRDEAGKQCRIMWGETKSSRIR
jgi:hypothetical protein